MTGGYPYSPVTEIFDLAANLWTQGIPLTDDLLVGTTLPFGDKGLLYFGGDGQVPYGHSKFINEFHGENGTWSMRSEELPENRKDMVMIMVPNGLITCV